MNALPVGELSAGSHALAGTENPLHESSFRFTPRISLKQPAVLRHILWKPSFGVFIARGILVLTYTSDIWEGSDMFSQSGQRNVSSNAPSCCFFIFSVWL